MKVPLSWVKDFVDISLSVEDLARRLTLAGLNVEEIEYVGLPMPNGEDELRTSGSRTGAKISGLEWDPDKIVVAEVLEVMPHPNADRLVLCRLNDGQQEHIVLTGAPNLYPYKGQGALSPSLKVAYAKEGAQLYDGHQPGQVLTTLKRAKIRGVESYSMICSEKELGISDEHEGVILLDGDAPVGMALVDYMGDAVFEIEITPNIARDANMLGVAREIAALTGRPLHQPDERVKADGAPIEGQAAIEILNPELNPRFVLGLVKEVKIHPSSYKVQRRLRLAGMRPINNIVDATNYVMLEIGQPLHAFDYDVLVQRAGGPPTILTRTAKPGERLTTLDGVERTLNDFTVLVCDTVGALSIAGVMGGAESEVSERTRSVLLEGAAWNFINIRRTATAQRLASEAGYRFSRGVHPEMALRGVRRGLELMKAWAQGEVAQGLIDHYPLPQVDPTVRLTPQDVKRWLGLQLSPAEIGDILQRLGFAVEIEDQAVRATTPDFRMDINTGIVGVADLIEEIARIYGYDRIPETRLADELPPQRGNPSLEREEQVRDLLIDLGLQEVVTYRMTSPEREARRLPDRQIDPAYVRLLNPIASDRNVLRKHLLSSVLEVVERNAHLSSRIALFEIGPVFTPTAPGELPDEPVRLAICMTGPRAEAGWQPADSSPMDFYDLKGVADALLRNLHLEGVRYEAAEDPTFHPGKCARLLLGDRVVGIFGELHPLVHEHYEIPATPLLAGEFDLQAILEPISPLYDMRPVSAFPPVLEDLAVIVDEAISAGRVLEVIRQAGGKTLMDVGLFDVYRGEQIGAGKKSLAYSLTYQAPDRTLTDQEVLQVRQRIIRRLDQELGAKIRS